MRIPILSERAANVTLRVAIVVVIALPLIIFPAAADRYQPVRGLALGVAGVLAALAASGRVARSRTAHIALGALAVAVVLALAAAVAFGLPSAVFGVHGRFQGLASGLAALVALGIGTAAARRTRFITRVAAVAVAAQAFIVAWQLARGGLPTGSMGNEVLVGAWTAVGVAVVAAGARAERGSVALALWASAAAGAIALGAIGSRGAWVGLAIAAVVLLLSARGVALRMAAAGVVAAMLLGVALGGAPALAKLDPGALSSGSAAARLQIWKGTAAMIADNPALGIGPGRFLYEFALYEPAEHARIEPGVRPDQAHSVLLQTAAESGVPAALAALVFFGAVGAMAFRGARSGDAASLVALVGLAAWAGQATFGISTIETDGLAFFLAGVALARGGVGGGGPGAGTAHHNVPRVALLALAAVLVLSCAYYLRADVLHKRGLDAFDSGNMTEAWRAETAAVEANPLVDIYRCSASDVAIWGGGPASGAIMLLERGLDLEPQSYDLAVGLARVRADMAPDAVALAAYLEAIERYPLGIEVRYEAMDLALMLGDETTARTLAEDMLEAYPADPFALDVMGRTAGAP